MSETAIARAPTAAFPEHQVKSAIDKWWGEQTLKRLHHPFAPAGTLFDVLVDIDSLTAVNILLVLEPVLGFEPPESLIRPGGYTDRTDMLGHLLPALRKLFTQRNLKSTSK
jgi:hypothetical protein